MSKDIETFRAWIPNVFCRQEPKKADVAEHPKAFDHVGLPFNKPTGTAGLFFI